jgi:hypothetical protein
MEIPLPILFNLLLVYHKVRKAFYMMEWDYDIKKIKKYFPNTFFYKRINKYFLISLVELPPIKEDYKYDIIPGVSFLDLELGKILEYSCPGQIIIKPIYSGITYYINGEQFQSEICWRYKDIKDKTKFYRKIAKMYDLKLTSEKAKNVRVNDLKANKLVKNVKDKNLRKKLKDLFTGRINSFKYEGDDHAIFFTDLVKYKDNIVTLNLHYLD